MKRSRVALLLFTATFAGSLLAAGLAGGEAGVAAQRFAGGSGGGGYCEFAYDPIDEEPYDSCDLGNCEFAGRPGASSPAMPPSQPWFDDDSLDFYDADSIGPAQPYMPPKVSASQDQPLYGVPAEDELPLGPDDDEVASPHKESESRVDVPTVPTAQVLEDPLTRTSCDAGSCTRHCWPELYGDTDPEADLVVPYAIPGTVVSVEGLIADVEWDLDQLLVRRRASSPADFVRRIKTPSEITAASVGFSLDRGLVGPTLCELEVMAAWGRQVQDWLAQQNWLAQEAATINTRAQFYLRGLTPPPAPAPRITVRWSKVDPAGRTRRFLSDLWSGYRDAAWGLSKSMFDIAGFPGLFDEPVRHAQDSTVRTRTSLRTPWRIDL